jgi:hypothetical protein
MARQARAHFLIACLHTPPPQSSRHGLRGGDPINRERRVPRQPGSGGKAIKVRFSLDQPLRTKWQIGPISDDREGLPKPLPDGFAKSLLELSFMLLNKVIPLPTSYNKIEHGSSQCE